MGIETRVATICLLLVLAVSSPAAGETNASECRCRLHAGQAEGTGMCLRAENARVCTLLFSAAVGPDRFPHPYMMRLKTAGIDTPPAAALLFAGQRAPERWTTEEMKTILPALFGAALYPQFAHFAESIADAFARPGPQTNLDAFRYRGRSASRGTLGKFSTVISRGCIELFDGAATFMVKTRWAQSRLHCDDVR